MFNVTNFSVDIFIARKSPDEWKKDVFLQLHGLSSIGICNKAHFALIYIYLHVQIYWYTYTYYGSALLLNLYFFAATWIPVFLLHTNTTRLVFFSIFWNNISYAHSLFNMRPSVLKTIWAAWSNASPQMPSWAPLPTVQPLFNSVRFNLFVLLVCLARDYVPNISCKLYTHTGALSVSQY